MDGLQFFVAATEIEREMRHAVRAAGPHGEYDPVDRQARFGRLRRLFRRGPDIAPVATEQAQATSGFQPEAAAPCR